MEECMDEFEGAHDMRCRFGKIVEDRFGRRDVVDQNDFRSEQEIMVEITLNEYRDLVRRDGLAASLYSENEELRKENEDLRKTIKSIFDGALSDAVDKMAGKGPKW